MNSIIKEVGVGAAVTVAAMTAGAGFVVAGVAGTVVTVGILFGRSICNCSKNEGKKRTTDGEVKLPETVVLQEREIEADKSPTTDNPVPQIPTTAVVPANPVFPVFEAPVASANGGSTPKTMTEEQFQAYKKSNFTVNTAGDDIDLMGVLAAAQRGFNEVQREVAKNEERQVQLREMHIEMKKRIEDTKNLSPKEQVGALFINLTEGLKYIEYVHATFFSELLGAVLIKAQTSKDSETISFLMSNCIAFLVNIDSINGPFVDCHKKVAIDETLKTLAFAVFPKYKDINEQDVDLLDNVVRNLLTLWDHPLVGVDQQETILKALNERQSCSLCTDPNLLEREAVIAITILEGPRFLGLDTQAEILLESMKKKGQCKEDRCTNALNALNTKIEVARQRVANLRKPMILKFPKKTS
jgi:hypothetical protein